MVLDKLIGASSTLTTRVNPGFIVTQVLPLRLLSWLIVFSAIDFTWFGVSIVRELTFAVVILMAVLVLS